MAAVDAWRGYGREREQGQGALDARLAVLGALYTGTWAFDARWPWGAISSTIYRNSRQIVNMAPAIVDVYEQLVWSGDLSSDGQPLPDGTRGAIPIDPQTGEDRSNKQLLIAFHELFAMWQWRMMMSVIPKTAAIFGDVLVEWVVDYDRGSVLPHIVYAGYVPDADLNLDEVGNVKAVAIEYPITIAASTAFGREVKAESYRFRKELDRQAFRYYKNDKPFDFTGRGAEIENPYGFVPACWFRHEIAVGSDRGIGAYEKAVMPALDLNSTLSSATDYQRKQFGMPIGVIGSAVRPGRSLTLPGGLTVTAGATAAEIAEARRASAENQNFLPLSEGGQFVTAQFPVGDTMQMVEFVHRGLIAQNPEAEYGKKLGELRQATAPGVLMQLAPIIAKVEMAQKNHNPQMVKGLQMSAAMMGFHLNRGDFPDGIVQSRPARYEAFRPFGLDSFGRGLLDATIPLSNVFTESKAEKAQWLAIAADLPAWALRELGIDEADIEATERDRAAQREAQMAAFSVASAGQDEDEGATGPSGPSGPTGTRA